VKDIKKGSNWGYLGQEPMGPPAQSGVSGEGYRTKPRKTWAKLACKS